MNSDRWLLPDGVEDVLPPRAADVEALRRQLLDQYGRWGYELVMPPMIEYLQSLLTGTGNDLDLQTFKLTDQLTGRMMGVRADMTPQAARIDAHSLRRAGVTRLCYAGHVLHARPANMLASRAPLQVGCELFGSNSAAADQEVMELMVETLRTGGVSGIHLDLAHVGIFSCLARESGLTASDEAQVFDAMRRKSIPELDELLGSAAEGSARAMLRELATLNGGAEVLTRARKLFDSAPEQVSRALDELEQAAIQIQAHDPDIEVGFDFCELRGYNYHTGLVFAAYTPNQGSAIAQGGRYDAVGEDFGRARPATGFSADLKAIMAAGVAGGPASKGAIWAPEGEQPGLRSAIRELRQSETVIQALPGDPQSAAELGCDRQLVAEGDHWRVAPL